MPNATNIQASFSNAIAGAEGYGASSTNLPTTNNNPGDIRDSSGNFITYPTAEAGYAALDHQVGLIFSGGSGTQYNPNMSIQQIAQKYSPDGASNWANNVAAKLGVPATTTPAQMLSGEVPVNMVARTVAQGSSDTQGVDDSNPPVAVPVSGSTISPDQIGAVMNAISPPLIITTGLDETPWFSDPSIVRADGPTSQVPTPISFALFYDLNAAPLPLSIKLNCSLETVERSLRHVSNRQATRTGFLVTLWGMQPDQITGSGSTGVFMNQIGLTDFLSVSQAPSDIATAVQQAFGDTDPDIIEASLASPGFLRVAAKDAFMEFLFCFKNNGIVWFQNPNYTGYTTSQSQLGPDAWSPQTGSSTFQNQGRRNDVLTRGGVAMYYRNSVYYGYFLSFNWTEDAEKPFSWNFTFTFKVERTVSVISFPDLS